METALECSPRAPTPAAPSPHAPPRPAAAPAAHLRLFLFAVAYEFLTCFVFFWFGFESR